MRILLVDDEKMTLAALSAILRREGHEVTGAADGHAALAALSAHETVTWDWQRTDHSPRGHLLQPLRADLARAGLPTAREVAALPHGARAHYAGIVICRQRPATAKDVTFMTLEDETGFVNLVLWARMYRQYRTLARTCSFLGVTGRIQSEDSVVHLVVDALWQPAPARRPARTGARDFR